VSAVVELGRDGPVALVTLARPEALNAISETAAEELAAALSAVARDPSARAVVLTGAGERAFSVGADLKERARFTLEDFHRNRIRMRALFAAARDMPRPTIASVRGLALGGGFELVLSCDLVVASEDAELGLPEARAGLLPAGGGTQLLARAVGPARAKELVFTGRRLSAQEARAWGLVNEVVPASELRDATMALARAVCRSSPVAVRAAKGAIDAAGGTPLDPGLEVEQAAWRVVVASEDRAEGIAAFNDKREPRWTGR
jgi:enoyl-CoA hydratase/carnithine racemase